LYLLAFVVTLALIIGWRLSDQAMAVTIGVLAGVAASVPTSLFVIWVVLRSRLDASPLAPMHAASAPPEPQVIIVQSRPASPSPSPAPAQRSLLALPAYAPPQAAGVDGRTFGPRNFTIIGGDESIE
jgi:hypothetical protein